MNPLREALLRLTMRFSQLRQNISNQKSQKGHKDASS